MSLEFRIRFALFLFGAILIVGCFYVENSEVHYCHNPSCSSYTLVSVGLNKIISTKEVSPNVYHSQNVSGALFSLGFIPLFLSLVPMRYSCANKEEES